MPKFSSRIMVRLSLLALAVFLLLGSQNDARFQRLGHSMKCACGDCNYILLECNHVGCPSSQRMRTELAAGVDRGDSDDNILKSFIDDYGPTVLLAPPATGFNRLAWVMPYLVLVLGLTTVTMIVRSWKSRPLLPHADAVAPAEGTELERFREQARKDTES